MIKTTMSEESLRKLIQEVVREEMKQNNIDQKETSTTKNTYSRKRKDITLSISNTSPWAVFGKPKPDPAKNFQRLERPRALPGWSEPYQEGEEPGPYRPKHIIK